MSAPGAAEVASESTPVAPKSVKMEVSQKRIEMLPLTALSVDRSYQRPATKRMEEMGKNWDPSRAQIITVSEREDGSFWIIDGQHRVGAGLIAGASALEADVRTGLSVQDEARLFDQLNVGRAHVNAVDRFKARLLYEDPQALAIRDLVREHGGEIAETLGNRKTGDTHIRAVRALENAYETAGPTGLAWILETIRAAWGDLDADNCNETTVSGLKQLWTKRRTKMDQARLVERLSDEGLSNIRRQAHAHGQIFGGSGPLNFYRAMVEAYNKNLSARSRIQP